MKRDAHPKTHVIGKDQVTTNRLVDDVRAGRPLDFAGAQRDHMRDALERLTGQKIAKSTKRPDLMAMLHQLAYTSRERVDPMKETLSLIAQKSLRATGHGGHQTVSEAIDQGLAKNSPIHGLVLTERGEMRLRSPTDDFVIADDEGLRHRGTMAQMARTFDEMVAVDPKRAKALRLRIMTAAAFEREAIGASTMAGIRTHDAGTGNFFETSERDYATRMARRPRK